MWKKSHIFIELLFNVDDDVASQSEIIAYRWFKVTEEASGSKKIFCYRLVTERNFFIATSWLKTFSFTSEATINQGVKVLQHFHTWKLRNENIWGKFKCEIWIYILKNATFQHN